jgi:hypothetical protein
MHAQKNVHACTFFCALSPYVILKNSFHCIRSIQLFRKVNFYHDGLTSRKSRRCEEFLTKKFVSSTVVIKEIYFLAWVLLNILGQSSAIRFHTFF